MFQWHVVKLLCFFIVLTLLYIKLYIFNVESYYGPTLSPSSFFFFLQGDGEDSRPGMRGGHQMVIDVQTGE